MTLGCPPRETASTVSARLTPPGGRRKSARSDMCLYFNQASISLSVQGSLRMTREFYDLVGGKKDAKCGKLMYIYSTGTSARCSAIMWRLEDGWGEGGSRGRGHMYTYG